MKQQKAGYLDQTSLKELPEEDAEQFSSFHNGYDMVGSGRHQPCRNRIDKAVIPHYSVKSDSVVTLRVTGNVTPTTPLTPMPGWSSPELRTKIQNALPDTARQFALRMYDSLKKHGLRREAGRVLAREDGQIEEIKDGEDGIGKENNELLGMEYLLKDTFVRYLRDMAKITPPIPQQVVRFSGVEYSRKSETSSDG